MADAPALVGRAERPLLVVGSGGLAREVLDAISAGAALGCRVAGVLDDEAAKHGRRVGGVEILGPVELARQGTQAVVVATGNPRDFGSRRRLVERIGLPDDRAVAVVHPAAVVGTGSQVGPGSILLAGCVLTVDVQVARHVAVMPGCVLPHDVVVEDYATLASGVRLGGGVRVCSGAYLGAAAMVREDMVVGRGAQLGMGSVLMHDQPADEVWVGTPARWLRPAGKAAGGAS